MSQEIEFLPLLHLVQEHISKYYSAVLTNADEVSELKPYIEKFLRDGGYAVPGLTPAEMIGRLCDEMVGYSVLTPYLGSEQLEEINVNAWDDIALTYRDGSIVKLREHFLTPQHAVDIIKRLLHHSGMIIDNASPKSLGHLPNNTRISALKAPVIDEEQGISVSLRLLHTKEMSHDEILNTGFATGEMVDFLEMCIRYGVSFVIAGVTSSGKTTFLNSLLTRVPDNKRVFTIEAGSREFSLIRRGEDGHVINNVVHTLSRPSDNPAYNITQEDLVAISLRFNPDLIAVGEMRDVECYSAVEASLTGHTVVSTVHAGPADAAHMRIALLCQKRFPIDLQTSLLLAGQAFPLIVYVHKLEDKSRKIMDISECVITPDGRRSYQSLYRYNILENQTEQEQCNTVGYFEKCGTISSALQKKLLQYGVPRTVLNQYIANRDLN